MKINFSKMHGLGNDFMVIDATTQTIDLNAELIQQWSDRHFGIGFDQLLLIEAPRDNSHLFTYRIFNADGQEVEQCGNGARCFARYVIDHGLTDQTEFTVASKAGLLTLSVQQDGQVTVNMGVPELTPEKIPFNCDEQLNQYELLLMETEVEIAAVSMGNPHAVLTVDNIDKAPLETIGKAIAQHDAFPQGVNVGFMVINDAHHIQLRVLERGVGETMACGSGACAAVVAGIINEQLTNPVQVDLPGGSLQISWQGMGESVMMTGPACEVFQGTLMGSEGVKS